MPALKHGEGRRASSPGYNGAMLPPNARHPGFTRARGKPLASGQ